MIIPNVSCGLVFWGSSSENSNKNTQSYPSIPRLTPKLARDIAEANLYIQCTMGAS